LLMSCEGVGSTGGVTDRRLRTTSHYSLRNNQTPLSNAAGPMPNRNSRTRCPAEVVGLTRFELVTPRLSSVCSNQLSYRPSSPGLLRYSPAGPLAAASKSVKERHHPPGQRPVLSKLDRRAKPVNPSLSRRDSHPDATSIRSILIGPPSPVRASA
jgi:hypothetical protein